MRFYIFVLLLLSPRLTFFHYDHFTLLLQKVKELSRNNQIATKLICADNPGRVSHVAGVESCCRQGVLYCFVFGT